MHWKYSRICKMPGEFLQCTQNFRHEPKIFASQWELLKCIENFSKISRISKIGTQKISKIHAEFSRCPKSLRNAPQTSVVPTLENLLMFKKILKCLANFWNGSKNQEILQEFLKWREILKCLLNFLNTNTSKIPEILPKRF